MKESLRKEIKELIKRHGFNCSVDYLKNETYTIGTWDHIWQNIISEDPNLSEDFIREFHDRMWWWKICWHSKLSENFIREFRDKVDWAYISRYQRFTSNFYSEFKDKINVKSMLENKNMKIDISPRIIEEEQNTISNRWEILDLEYR